MKLNGAEILIECLKEQSVDTVFGYPGGTVLDIYDALLRDGNIKHILTSHEQGAAHAADGYARVTGKVGVVLATSGPGATNLVTGIATAFMDSVPMVAITGNVSSSLLGRDSFQEIDITGITIPITKHNYIVKDVNELASVIRHAFYIASSGRKGPVLIDILKNVQADTAEYTPKNAARYKPAPVYASLLYDAAEKINASKKPLIIAGGGVISCDSGQLVKELAEKISSPVCHTLMGKGVIPHDNPLFLGMIGMHGTVAAAKAITECDTIIALGTRFSDRVALDRDSFSKGKTVIHVEIDNAEINKNIPATIPIMADVAETLKTLIPLCKEQKRDDWAREIEGFKKMEDDKETLAEKIMSAAASIAPKDSILCTDVGQHQMWAAKHFGIDKPRLFCSSGGLGTMGYGMGASIGAYFGSGKFVTLVTGDGCFNMNMNEFSTAAANNVPMVILLVNNKTLGMVRQWQKIFYDSRFSNTDITRREDFPAFARSMGGEGYTIEGEADIGPVLEKAYKEALKKCIPVLVDCLISTDDNVLPMIKPNSPYSEQINKI